MRSVLIVLSVWVGVVGSNSAFAAAEMMHRANHRHAMGMVDTRTALGLPEEMKQHQLSAMRDHLEAIDAIVAFMSENKFDEASAVAHARLGLTPEMRKMCSMPGNEKFMALGMAFHQSGDDLGDALRSGDVNVSLRALHKTMQYCTECHAGYRQ